MNNEILTRECEIRLNENPDAKSKPASQRTIRVSFSSEAPVIRRDAYGEAWTETLGHEKEEVNLSRLNNSAPVLYNHQRGEDKNRIGVVERAWIENGRGYADLRISKRADVEGIWQDIQDGILRNVSVAYKIDEKNLQEKRNDEPDLYRVTSWTPIEISLVDIPADHTVGIGRNFQITKDQLTNLKKEEDMTNNQEKRPIETVQTDEIRGIPIIPPLSPAMAVNNAVDAETIRRETLFAEEQRRSLVRNLFKPFQANEVNGNKSLDELLARCLDDTKINERQAKDILLAHLGNNVESRAKEPTSFNSSSSSIRVGESEADKFRKYAEEAIAFRSGIDTDAKPTELYGYSLIELARKSLEVRGISTQGLDKRDIVARSFTHSSSDFPILLANNAHKSMLKGYSEVEEVFSQITSTTNLSDFKTHTRVRMSEFGEIDEITEGGEYRHGTFSEKKEEIQLLTYGKKFSITRQAIINDDLSAFTEIPRKMGRSVKRKIGDLVFSVLTSNPMMSDGLNLFHASHSNLSSKGSILSAASIGHARTAMRMHRDIAGKAVLNIKPSLMIIPAALEDIAYVLMNSETDPAQTNSRVPNPVRNSLKIVSDARLDAHSTSAWYLAANPSQFDVIEIGYLDGNSNPYLEQQEGWDVDGVEFKVRIDAAVKAMEWRTLYMNPGI